MGDSWGESLGRSAVPGNNSSVTELSIYALFPGAEAGHPGVWCVCVCVCVCVRACVHVHVRVQLLFAKRNGIVSQNILATIAILRVTIQFTIQMGTF